MFEVHVCDKPVRVNTYIGAVEIANQFQRDYGIFVAITEDKNPSGSYLLNADGGPRNA